MVVAKNVKGYATKVVGGICGTRSRILEALGVEAKDLYDHLRSAIKNPTPCDMGDGPVNEVLLDSPKTSDFPVLTHFEDDPGPYLTSAIVYVRSPDGSVENVSFHRLLVIGERRLAIRVVPRHLYRIMQMARGVGLESLDVSISNGRMQRISSGIMISFLPLFRRGIKRSIKRLYSRAPKLGS